MTVTSKEIAISPEINEGNAQETIQELVNGNELLLFMKGNSHFPQCGFSARVVQILDELGAEYQSVNVLENMAIRDGIKQFSNWPTIPQIYYKQKFIGGCDITMEMYQSGELKELFSQS